ncbi:MAG: hypothetical protein EBY28_25710, partial [Betaproteobacteria bacterium]|nr:hypothetical protein [Betaproteobacteria bacterium]
FQLGQIEINTQHSTTICPQQLNRKLTEILSAEGYAVGGASSGLPISLIPIAAANSLLVFAVDPAVLAHVVDWAQKFDALGNDVKKSGRFFSYRVKYSDAQSLAKTMQEVMSGAATPALTLAPGTRVVGDLPVARPPGRIVVNAAANTLIFTSTADEYEQILAIMRELDRPAKSALIEVTVAEVRISDQQQLGIDWNLPATTVGGRAVTGGTLGTVGVSTGGFSLSFLNNAGAVRANLNALASANRANILSTPRVMARNGESATIQVGQEVPIVTSQQSSGITSTTSGAAPGVLQSIQYRNTGVILKVKPVIFAGNRIELEVSQEVSSAGATTTGVSSSPTFNTRKIDTKLSIRDGATVLLGGLISTNDNAGNYVRSAAMVELAAGGGGAIVRNIVVPRSAIFDTWLRMTGAAQDAGLGSLCLDFSGPDVNGIHARIDVKGQGPWYFNRDGVIDHNATSTSGSGRVCWFNIDPGPVNVSAWQSDRQVMATEFPVLAGRHTHERVKLLPELTGIHVQFARETAAHEQLGGNDALARYVVEK